jgi:hypothetical protein
MLDTDLGRDSGGDYFLGQQDSELARAKMRPIRSGYKRASATRCNPRDLGVISLACTSGTNRRLHARGFRRENIPQRL